MEQLFDIDRALRLDGIVRDALRTEPDESMVDSALRVMKRGTRAQVLVAHNLLCRGNEPPHVSRWRLIERAASAATIAGWP